MPKREVEKLSRTNLVLNLEDYRLFQALYGETIGVSSAIRTLMRAHLEKLENKMQELAP